ncbi:hypothetical protein ATK36_0481 [Amycolatopsis sulphurea]|uniref:Uncharacterized protein n=1 Tax=Amycolatopsis sulphurea TaxID=76022 RepID=A0A2A9G2I4_9PSEU|nr:hypothetical protein [Amycolatopsis sulphurea]PFG56945.1 hypothetical protein ATK36_0481 [Amycolatopsis sulphurea]
MTRYTAEEAGWLALAAHELAHAVACTAAATTRAGRLTVVQVVVEPGRSFVEHSEVDPGNQDQVNTAVVVALAGQEGAARWAQRHAGYWRGSAMRMAAHGCEDDHAYVRRMSRYSDRSPAWLRHRARAVVAANWGRIDRLTHRLVADGRLPGHLFT